MRLNAMVLTPCNGIKTTRQVAHGMSHLRQITNQVQLSIVMTTPLTQADYLKNFEIRRSMICHEDNLIGYRLGASMSIQSFMVAAGVLLFLNAFRNPILVGLLLALLATAALSLNYVFYTAINAARREQSRIRSGEPLEDGRVTFNELFPLAAEPTRAAAMCQLLQAHGVTFLAGHSYVKAIQVAMALTWVPLLVIGAMLALGFNPVGVGPIVLPNP